MIVVKLIGGLGNQMFQYATARRLAIQHNTDLFLDCSGFAKDPLRNYELDIFNVHASIATPEILRNVSFIRKWHHINSIFSKENKIRYVKEQTINFDKDILSLPDNVYLDGYWQSEKYFLDISDYIRNEFSFVRPLSPENKKLLHDIQSCNAVSVHVRRGDYFSNPETKKVHYVCDEEYYQRAGAKIQKILDRPEFFIFSDDPEWARQHVVPDGSVTYVSQKNGTHNSEDMHLMSLCQHHIIANSSFSWWGAWLGKNEGQVVVAPERWYNIVKFSKLHCLPENWMRI